MFFQKRNPTLDCYTYSSAAHRLFPVTPSAALQPSWFLKTRSDNRKPNVKGCPGIRSLLSSGFILPLWTDVEITASNNLLECRVDAADGEVNRFKLVSQVPAVGFKDDGFSLRLKINPPWLLRCTDETQFHFSGAFYHLMDSRISVAPGITDYFYQMTPTIQAFISLTSGSPTKIVIPAGTPLAHVVPLTTKPVSLVTHKVTKEEFSALGEIEDEMKSFFSFGYYKRKKMVR